MSELLRRIGDLRICCVQFKASPLRKIVGTALAL